MSVRRRWTMMLTRGLVALAVAASVITAVTPAAPAPVADAASVGQATKYVAISPLRVLDTRDPGFGILRDRDTLSVDPLTPGVVSAAGVDPLDVEAVAINLTITQPIAPSWLKSFPTAITTPGQIATSAVNNRIANETIANFAIVPVGANGRISIESLRGSHIVVDVQGLFVRATSSSEGRFVPFTVPTRIADTRETQLRVPANGDLVIDFTTVGVPAGASAAVINMVATETLGSGFLTVHPGGVVPNSSNLNYTGVGHTIAGSAIARLDNGRATIHVSGGATHIVVDVIGYMTGPGLLPSSSGLFVPVDPERHYDSRPSEPPFNTGTVKGPLAARTSRAVQIAGKLSVPATGVLGVATNLTMTNTDGPGFLVMYPKEPMPDPYSSVNSMFANHSIANHAIARLDQGSLRVYSLGRSDFVIDVTGYFLDGTGTVPTRARREPTNPAPMPDVDPGTVPSPPDVQSYAYLIEATGSNAQFGAYSRNGKRYYGWKPCQPITYAVNTERATQTQIDALNRAIRSAEDASGFDFQYVGEVTGSLNTNNIDPRVPGGQAAMAVFAFSDPYATPILAGNVIGIGGIGPNVLGSPVTFTPPDTYAWIVRGGFAIVDVTDIIDVDEIESAFAHEIGHMVGLDHVNAAGELMRPIISNPPQTVYGGGDTRGLHSIGDETCLGARLSANAEGDEPRESFEIDVSYAVADEAHAD